MKEILKEGYSEIEVQKSKFISYAFFVKNPAEVDYFLKKIEKEHQKARHICYAYKIGNNVKYNDDGEPSGTAGRPLLNLINQFDLDNVVIFVVRYFGGTLLGSGRLLRTYVESGKQAVLNATLVNLIYEKYFQVSLTYEIYESFLHFGKLNHFTIIKSNFNDTIVIEFYASLDFKSDLEELFYPKLKVLETKEIWRREENYGKL